MDEVVKRRYRHGNLPDALRAAAKAILEEDSAQSVGLREAARRVGVSPTAAYRHFQNKDDLLASVAADGFTELTVAIDAARKKFSPLMGLGFAYVDFALRKRGLFRLMFGPILAQRTKYPALDQAAATAFSRLRARKDANEPYWAEPETMVTWGLIHGLSSLLIDGVVPYDRILPLVEKIILDSSSQRRIRRSARDRPPARPPSEAAAGRDGA